MFDLSSGLPEPLSKLHDRQATYSQSRMQHRDLLRIRASSIEVYHLCCIMICRVHWLYVPECINYKLNITGHRCFQEKAPRSYAYTVDCYTQFQKLLATDNCYRPFENLTVPHYWLNTFRYRALLVTGSTSWNLFFDRSF